VIRHAGLVARRLGGRWRGALIEGPSGGGKSDLALRLLELGWRLVADDRVRLWAADGRLYGRAPEALRGLIEARGLGVLRAAEIPFAEVVLLARPGTPDRLPEPHSEELLSVPVPVLVVDPLQASATAKFSRAMEAFAAAHKGRM